MDSGTGGVGQSADLQQGIGVPPLGPGAPPATRLAAFVAHYLELVATQLDLVLLPETATPGTRLRTSAHAFWRQHCRYFLHELGAPEPDLRADLLLAGLAAEQVVRWLRDEHRVLTDLGGSLCSAALALAQQSNQTVQAKCIV